MIAATVGCILAWTGIGVGVGLAILWIGFPILAVTPARATSAVC